MDWSGISALVVAVLTAAGVLWERIRRSRRLDVTADVAADREETETTIEQMRRHARDRERQHNADMARVEKQLAAHETKLADLAARERDCQIRAARQEVEIGHLREEIADLKSELQRVGVCPPATAEHKPLGDGK